MSWSNMLPPRPTSPRALEDARAEMSKHVGNWLVIALNDDGRFVPVRRGLTYSQADELAGRMRDESTEDAVAAGWNYLPWSEATLADWQRNRG